jgi:ABC-type transport system involved in cytochrome bd biosynthesis fused ATPase/permease subunit
LVTRCHAGGEHRVRLAHRDAALILLDEPTAGLDPESAEPVRRAIRAASERRTVLLVTNDPELAAMADRIVVLDELTANDLLPPRGGNKSQAARR